jgi:hypothetical protein
MIRHDQKLDQTRWLGSGKALGVTWMASRIEMRLVEDFVETCANSYPEMIICSDWTLESKGHTLGESEGPGDLILILLVEEG